MSNILIIETRPGIGDLCMYIPRMQEIKNKYPKNRLFLITKKRSKAKEIFKYDHLLDSIEYIEQLRGFKIFNFLKNNKFTRVFCFHSGTKYLKYYFYSLILNYKFFWYGVKRQRSNQMQIAIKKNKEWLGLNKFNNSLEIILPFKKNTRLNQIVLGISSSGSSDNKKWPISYFCSLIEKLIPNYEFIIAGDKSDINEINEIKVRFKELNIISLENLELIDSIIAIKDSNYYIGNDTGFLHICSGLGMKSFCLYGDTPSHNAIYNQNIIPILPEGYSETFDGSLAMKKIKVSNVLSVFKYYC